MLAVRGRWRCRLCGLVHPGARNFCRRCNGERDQVEDVQWPLRNGAILDTQLQLELANVRNDAGVAAGGGDDIATIAAVRRWSEDAAGDVDDSAAGAEAGARHDVVGDFVAVDAAYAVASSKARARHADVAAVDAACGVAAGQSRYGRPRPPHRLRQLPPPPPPPPRLLRRKSRSRSPCPPWRG